MRINLKLKIKKFLINIIPTVILIILKNYIDLKLINDLVDNLIIAISALSWDFNPFTSEITKVFFNGNSGDGDETSIPISSILNPDTSGEEGEGSDRQNNPQGSSINPEEVKEVEKGIVVSGETFEQAKALYEKNSEFFGKMDEISDDIMKFDDDQRRLIEEEVRIIEERKAELKEQIKDYFDWKNEGQSEESMSDLKRQIIEDSKTLYEDYKNLKDKAHAHKAEVNKMYSDLIKAANESNNK